MSKRRTSTDKSIVNILITIGSERLYSDLSRKFSNRATEEAVNVIRIDKSGGCVDRSEDYMKALRHSQIREYFFGHGEDALAPSSMTADFSDLNIFRVIESTFPPPLTSPLFMSGDAVETPRLTPTQPQPPSPPATQKITIPPPAAERSTSASPRPLLSRINSWLSLLRARMIGMRLSGIVA